MKKLSLIMVFTVLSLLLYSCANSKSDKAQYVDNLILEIGEVTMESEEKISEAEAAVKALEESDYEQLEQLPLLAEAKETLVQIKNGSQYQNALEKISDGEYTEAEQILRQLEDSDYKLSKQLLDNMDKLEALLENEWINSEYGWTYISSFSVTVSEQDISLYNLEKEYSGSEYFGYYNDEVNLAGLLDDGKTNVICDLRDNFELDITDVLNGVIVRNTEWVSVVYNLKK